MKFSFTYRLEDYRAIQSAKSRHARFAKAGNISFWLLVLANFAFAAWPIWMMLNGHIKVEILMFANLAIGLLLLAGRYIFFPWYLRWYLKQQMVEGELISMETNEDGLFVQTSKSHAQMNWLAFIRADEEKGHFLVWINKMQAYSIPKRAFASNEEVDQFRSILTANIKNRTF